MSINYTPSINSSMTQTHTEDYKLPILEKDVKETDTLIGDSDKLTNPKKSNSKKFSFCTLL